MRKTLAILVPKILLKILRLLGKNGSALPGLVAEKIKPNLLDDYSSSFGKGIIMVTGTNGKTTTTKMIVGILESCGYSVFTNRSGSNFTRGVLSSLIDQSPISGRMSHDYAVIESDEAYSRYIAASLKPAVLVVTNIMRDQMDRYGEIDYTAELILEAANLASHVVLNSDDPPVAVLGEKVDPSVSVSYFGVSEDLRSLLPSDEELHGNVSGGRFKGKVNTTLMDINKGEIKLQIGNSTHGAKVLFEGVHNGVNVASALEAIAQINKTISIPNALKGLSVIKPAFGRGEKINIQDRDIHIALAKNPGGFNQNLRTFLSNETKVVLILINDNYADSRDVSWLWDVNFERLKDKDIQTSIILGGTRAFDMALRLQYIGVEIDEIDINIQTAFEHALSAGSGTDDVTVFPTYTAMLELRKILKQYGHVEAIW